MESGTVPIVVAIDIEPDRRAIQGRSPEPTDGFEKLVGLVPALRDRLTSASGTAAALTWCIRIDPQIEEIYGSSTWLIERYQPELDEFRCAEDELGLHPHSWRWQGRWVSDVADPAWVSQCVTVGLDGYREAFGQSCRVYKHGDNFMSTALACQLDEAGVGVDLSIVPGMPAARGLAPTEETAGWLPDTRTVPRHAYRPARDDFRSPDPDRRDGLVILPETVGLSFAVHPIDGWPVPTGYYEPLVLWLDPPRFREMLQIRLRATTLTHLLFGVRSDTALHPDLWSNVETNLAELAGQLRGRHRWCTGSRGAELALAQWASRGSAPVEPVERARVRASLWLRDVRDPGFEEQVDLETLDLHADHPLLVQAPPPSANVSVIIPVYEGGRYLRAAIDSVIAQTEPPGEVVIVVDGSDDDDLDFLRGLTAPFSVRVERQGRNTGQSVARNHGAALATGELLAFLDQDDAWHPEHLAVLCESFREDPVVMWSYCDFDEVDADGHIVIRSFLREHGIVHPKYSLGACLERDLMVLPSASVMRREAFERIGGFDEALRGYEDDDLYVRGFREGWRFAFHPAALTLYRVHSSGDSMTRRFAESRLRYGCKLQQAIKDDRRLGRYYFRDLVAPRFFGGAVEDYLRAVSASDWVSARASVHDIRFFGRLRRVRAGLWWRLLLLRRPRVFRILLRMHEHLPRWLRLTKNPAVRLR